MVGIIQSLLDIDFYKLTMAQVAFRHFRDVQGTYAFANRTRAVSLPAFVDEEELGAELDHVQAFGFTAPDLDFLRESPHIPAGLFSDEFLAFLADLRLPDVDLSITPSTFEIEVSGSWPEATFWETLILSIVTELYGRSLLRLQGITAEVARSEGSRRLTAKIDRLKGDPRVRFSDFGTRRRFSRDWHREVIETLARELPAQFLGTSNVLLAKEQGLRPIGTFAHEMDMIFSGIFHGSDDEIRASHSKVLNTWWDQYGEDLSIALTDTYGTDFFFRDFAPGQAVAWRGLRHDSGDPFEFGEKAIAFYEGLGIDPSIKQIVFSDGLEVDTMLQLADRFDGRIQVVFGWGTNLTNDVGFEPVSLVVKAVRAGGYGTVKLCDNLDKATGAPQDIERFKRIFGHTEVPRLGVKY
jgi:nicotinate phosphoribosyltransferase